MKRNGNLHRGIASLMTLMMLVQPTLALAQQWVPPGPIAPPEQVGREAQSFGNSIVPSDIGSFSDGNIAFPGGGNISINELFPGQQPGQDPSRFFPHAVGQSELEGISNSDSEMNDWGSDAHGSLQADVDSGNPSIQGAAYEVLLGAFNMSRPNFDNDPFLDRSRDVYDNIDQIAAEFGDCNTETDFFSGNIEAHVPDYQLCERVEDRSAECTIDHRYSAGVVSHHSGPYNLDSCGDGCVNLWIGRVGDNYWSGWCSIYEQSTQVVVDNPDALTNAVITRAKWDDYMQIYIGPPGQETLVWESHPGVFPPETAGKCELSTSWDRNPNLNVTQHFKNVAPGTVLSFKVRVSVAGEGEGFARIRLSYDTNKAVTRDEWTPDSCIDAANAINDDFARGEFMCIDNPKGADGCVVVNGVRVCEEHLKPSPIDGIDNLCRKVQVRSDYDFYKGDMECFETHEGELICPTNTGGNLNSCTELEANPECGFISSECVDGARGASGKCYVHVDTFDCGGAVTVPTLEQETTYQCSGPIRCMGSDCLDITRTQSSDFARASALMNAAQFMGSDMACTGLDEDGNPIGDQDVTCTVFEGNAGECKKAVGGTVNCCESPGGLSLQDYLTVLMAVPKLDSAITNIGNDSPLAGLKSSYQVLREPITTGWSHVTQPFTSYMDNVMGFKDQFVGTAQDFALEAVGKLKAGMSKISGGAIGNAAGSAVSDGAIEGASASFTEQILGEAGSAMLGNLMLAYQIYVVSMIIVQMIWECSKEEFEMNAQRELKTCHYTGSYCKTRILGQCIERRESYCCFNSPLSRIIQEQARAQLGMSWGSAENPQCAGLTVDQIASLDWDRINLDEWLGLLQANGVFPDPNSMNMDSLTGIGSAFNTEGDRSNIEDRTLERLEGLDVDALRDEARDRIENPFR